MGWAAPLLWMADGVLGNWGLLLAFLACCVVPFVLVALVLGRVYRLGGDRLPVQGRPQRLQAVRPVCRRAALTALLRPGGQAVFRHPHLLLERRDWADPAAGDGSGSGGKAGRPAGPAGPNGRGIPGLASGGRDHGLLPIYVGHISRPLHQLGGSVPVDPPGSSGGRERPALGKAGFQMLLTVPVPSPPRPA